MTNRILNLTYGNATERKADQGRRLVISPSQISYNGTGAMAQIVVNVNTGYSLKVRCESTTTTITGNTGADQNVNHNFAAAGYVTFTGDLDQVTKFNWENDSDINGDIAIFETWTALITLDIFNTSIFGLLSSISALTGLVSLLIHSTSVTGTTADLMALGSLVTLYVNSTVISGPLSNLAGLTLLRTLSGNDTSISGDAADISTLTDLRNLLIQNTLVDTYTQGVLPDWDITNINIANLSLDQTESNDFLIDLDTASVVVVSKTLTMTGNTAPSGAGITAVNSLVLKGRTVNTD